MLFVVIALIALLHWISPNDKQISDQIISMFKDTVLPVVTLILGYFFGKR